jgi:DNA-binding transcriptional ArsR family regulator
MTTLLWESGSAYDFFIALYVLHHPGDFGLRPTWAAGMRSRLPTAQRADLERAQAFLGVPLAWLHALPPEAKEANDALAALAALPPAARLPALLMHPKWPPEARQALDDLAQHGQITPAAWESLRQAYEQVWHPRHPQAFTLLAAALSAGEAFGTALLDALRAFYQAFFREEEAHLRPWLARGLTDAQALAARTDLPTLLETLSGGVRFEMLEEAPEVVLVPSYWSTPLVFYGQVTPTRWLMVFGCRPAAQAPASGENLPTALLHRLKALADPTRLRILRYLAQGPQTPSGLARQLRLRPPTVVHHLQALRLAGLVHITITREGERRYALRREAITAAFTDLEAFLHSDSHPSSSE